MACRRPAGGRRRRRRCAERVVARRRLERVTALPALHHRELATNPNKVMLSKK